jgi:hypothetical protein
MSDVVSPTKESSAPAKLAPSGNYKPDAMAFAWTQAAPIMTSKRIADSPSSGWPVPLVHLASDRTGTSKVTARADC